jgi:hypothetical protein
MALLTPVARANCVRRAPTRLSTRVADAGRRGDIRTVLAAGATGL